MMLLAMISATQRHLTVDVGEAEFLLDLSNVVRSRRADGSQTASLHRLSRLLAALGRYAHDPQVRVYAVADQSLLSSARLFTNQRERQSLRVWRDARLLEVVADADVRLLELAEATGLRIVSGDRFRGHRDAFPWLQGSTKHVIEPVVDRAGGVTFRPRDLGVVAPWEISNSQEQDQLKKQGLLEGRRRVPRWEVLGRRWRCPDRRCSLYDDSRGTNVLLPRMRGGRPTCEIHGLELLDDGPRSAAVQLKILHNGQCVGRFTVPAGARIPVGRAPGDGVMLGHWLDGPEGRKVSRTHLVVSLDGERVLVRDVSTNGTRINLAGGGKVELEHGTSHPVEVGDIIRLASNLALTRSGRRFPSELAGYRPGPVRSPEDPPPTER
jgi:FHA domain